jgi:ATP-dependent helicase/nuclease subunit B
VGGSEQSRIRSWSNAVLRDAVAAFCASHDECLVVVPSGNATVAMDRGTLGLHRLTLRQLVRQLAQAGMAEQGVAPIGRLAAEAIAARVVFRARQTDTLRYFEPVAALPGFARALARTIDDLRLAGVASDRLADGAPAARDLAWLLAEYEGELEQRRLVDWAGELALARAAVEAGKHRWRDLPVALWDIAAGSWAEERVLAVLLDKAPMSLVAELGAEQATDLRHPLDFLRANLFSDAERVCADAGECFDFFSSPGEGLESVEIARRILRLASEGVRFDDVAILLRNPERYQPSIEDALRRAGIAAHFTTGSRRADPAGRAFLALLGCATENLSASRFAEYMSLGQMPLRADGEVPPAPRRWEEYLVDAAVVGGRDRWERRLTGLEAEWTLQDAAEAAENAEGTSVGQRVQQLRGLREFAMPLIDALANLPRTGSWGEWLRALEGLAPRALRDAEGVIEVLRELEPMAEVGPATLEEVVEVLTDRLRFMRREVAARRWGAVFVGSLDEARGVAFQAVFVPGLAEGLFPQRLNEDPLLLDELRAAASEHLPVRAEAARRERERLHVACAAARDRLIASYPRMEVAEARPRVPSFYALELPRALYGAVPDLEGFEKAAREKAPTRLNWPAPREAADAIDDAEYDLTSIQAGSARHVLEVNAHAARSMRARWRRWNRRWFAEDGWIVDATKYGVEVAEQSLTKRWWSASSLEQFAVCPYKFALRGVLRLRAREDGSALEQMDPLTRGTLFHEVQARFYAALRTQDQLPVTRDALAAALGRLELVLAQVAEEYAERLCPAIRRVWDSEIDGLRTDLRGWLRFTAENEAEWTPIAFELDFEEPLVDLVQLHGRIDAVETDGTVHRVVDYKTGKPPELVPQWVGGGKQLQPLLYALAVEQKMATTVACGRLLYATQRGAFTPMDVRVDERAKQVLTKALGNMQSMIESGFLPPVPTSEACAQCGYRGVCGPYEERRLSKKDVGDERLDALRELRGLA